MLTVVVFKVKMKTLKNRQNIPEQQRNVGIVVAFKHNIVARIYSNIFHNYYFNCILPDLVDYCK